MNNLFSFQDDLANVNIEEIQAEALRESDKTTYINEPGVYTLSFTKAVLAEDKNKSWPEGWVYFHVSAEDTNGAKFKERIPVPTTTNLRYPTRSGKNQLWALIKLQQFAAAIGVDLYGKDIFKNIQKLFGNEDAIAGRTGRFTLGYEGAYCVYRDDKYVLMVKGKEAVDADSGAIILFPTRQDAEMYCTNVLNTKYDPFIRIVKCDSKLVKADDEKANGTTGF